MFIMVIGLYDRPMMVNLDTVTDIRPSESGGTKIHTLNGTLDVQNDFDSLTELIMSNMKRR